VPSTVPAVTEVTDTIDTSTVKLTATLRSLKAAPSLTPPPLAPVTGSPVVVTLANGQTITIEVGKPPAP
jgi:surface adhesion protein